MKFKINMISGKFIEFEAEKTLEFFRDAIPKKGTLIIDNICLLCEHIESVEVE